MQKSAKNAKNAQKIALFQLFLSIFEKASIATSKLFLEYNITKYLTSSSNEKDTLTPLKQFLGGPLFFGSSFLRDFDPF